MTDHVNKSIKLYPAYLMMQVRELLKIRQFFIFLRFLF